ncbi:hypothetical protein HU200_051233 [Digitaria exilis]|uniref:Reverse transcriptase zinc-binding domain-containing protein n=1 Tax=Digitaria exilis TaxID=1010633 RepID=A0A835E5H3_9POAL|nr:hypothetical protein HU200_051233 [Digitaria exilis]
MLILESYIRTVQLNDQQDVISWKLTASGQYTAKSAYGAQLVGSYCTFDSKAIWKAKVEGKHRFFTWLLVQYLTMEEWWNLSLQGLNKELKQRTAALMIYTACNIWKERNRRIFEGVAALPAWVVTMIKEEVNLGNWSCGGEELLPVS